MTDITTLERIKAADPVPSTGSLPAGAMSSEALLARIDERSTNVTDIKTAPKAHREPEPPNRWRGPAIAMAVAAAILLIVGIISVISLTTDDAAPAAPAPETTDALTDPVAVVTEFNRLYDTGDVGFEAFYSEDLKPDQAGANRTISQYMAVTGMTVGYDCTAVGERVQCTTTRTSGIDPSQTYAPFTGTYVVVDGKITEMGTSGPYENPMIQDRPALIAYAAWVRDNHPDKYDDLILFGTTLVLNDAETRRLQGQMIQQYHEAAAAAASDPLTVVAEYNARYDAGDHAGFEAILDPVSPELFEYELNSRRSSTYLAVTGMTIDYDCAADGNVVTCTTTRTSGLNPAVVYEPFVVTTVVENGLIISTDVGPAFDWTYSVDRDEFENYQVWVSENHADKYDDLFLRSLMITNTEEEIRVQKLMVQRYLEATQS